MYPVGSGTGDALAETSCENLCAQALVRARESREAMRGKQTKRNASEPDPKLGRGEAWRHRRRRFSLNGKLNEFSPALVRERARLGARACARPGGAQSRLQGIISVSCKWVF